MTPAECHRLTGVGLALRTVHAMELRSHAAKIYSRHSRERVFQAHQYLDKEATFLGSATLCIQMGPPQERWWSRLLLSEVACLPREFTIVVEEENFAAARDDRHELRMKFDVSPYPALEAYNEQGRSGLRGESTIPWLNEPRSFCAGQLPGEFERARAIMGYHTSNCVVS